MSKASAAPTCRARGAREAALYRSSHMPRCMAMRRFDSAGMTKHSCIHAAGSSSSEKSPASMPAVCRKLGRFLAQPSECAAGGGPMACSQPASRGSRRSAPMT